MMAGMTDYTGVGLETIVPHLENWRNSTAEVIENLRGLQNQVDILRNRLSSPDALSGYLDYFIDLFERYLSDFKRLLAELTLGIKDAHVQIVKRIYESSTLEENISIRFKNEHIDCQMKDENLRWLVDKIYSETRGMLIDYQDLSNLAPRLSTFVGTDSGSSLNSIDRYFAMIAIEEARKSIPRIRSRVRKLGLLWLRTE